VFVRHYIPPAGWALFILLLSSLPSSNLPESSINGLDKIVHFTLYLLLSHMLIVAFKKQIRFVNLRITAIQKAVIISVCYGIFMEVLQGTVFVSRSIELLDIFANSMGALAGVLSFKLVYGKLKN
jgi:VanZ family protein